MLLPLLLMLGSGQVSIEPQPDGSFRVSAITYPDSFEAQMAMAVAAKRACKGKGKAVGEGVLRLDPVPGAAPAGKRRKLKLSEGYRCLP
jgi:hypothetical protein